ncbi:MAG: hypothetical protein AAF596_03105, partial [Planctomycetota bacterium]
VSWKQGDLDQNGDTDLADFALLRNAMPSAITVADLNAALAAVGSSVTISTPEPTTGLLLTTAGLLAMGHRSVRRRRG